MKYIVTFTKTIEGTVEIEADSSERPELDEVVAQKVSQGDYVSDNEDLIINEIVAFA